MLTAKLGHRHTAFGLPQDRDDLSLSVSACLHSKSPHASCRENSTHAAPYFRGGLPLTDPDQQRRSIGGDTALPISGSGGTDSYLKARTALTVYQAQERQLAIQKKRGTLVDRARAEALVFRLARQESDVWVTLPARVAEHVPAEEERSLDTPVAIDDGTVQRVLECHVRKQLDPHPPRNLLISLS
jgi:hypothetical protein